MEKESTRVLILQNEISSYNVTTYNEISKEVSLTLGYLTKDKSSGECRFEKKRFDTRKIGSFKIVIGINKYCKQFDVVCFVPDFHIPSYCVIPFLRHHNKMISWSIGFRCSYVHPYLTDRKHTFLDWVFQRVLSKCDANIFYMEKSKEFWKGTSLRMDNVFVAPNTTNIEDIPFKSDLKKDFLFVGTLYRGKGLDILIDSFHLFKKECHTDIKLTIVGGGGLECELKSLVKEKGLENDVVFTGPIYNESLLATYFQKSILCFSPTQAGLSVPKSMGYGVPFVTRKDAITGGELYHIENNRNGIIYTDNIELPMIMKDAFEHREKYVDMGRNALEYYREKATIKKMAEGALSAIHYVL